MIIPVTGFPWSQLITAAATLSAVGLTGMIASRGKRRGQRLAAYAQLIQATGDLLDTHRQNLPPPEPIDEFSGAEFNRRIDAALREVRRSVAVVELTGSVRARHAAKGLRVAAQGQAGTRVTRYTDHAGKEGWAFEVQGAGDVFFEEQIDAFIELTRRELSRKRPANGFASIDWARPPTWRKTWEDQ
jgi:hypothetical protein